MKLTDVKHIIEKYFEEISPEDIVKIFEDMGVKFEDIKNKREIMKAIKKEGVF